MAFGGLVGLVGPLGLGARADAREQRIADRLERGARPGSVFVALTGRVSAR